MRKVKDWNNVREDANDRCYNFQQVVDSEIKTTNAQAGPKKGIVSGASGRHI